MSSKRNDLLLICDLDNTLYDWFGYFIPSIYALIEEASRILDCDQDQLIHDLREVHQAYHDSEHPFALLETKTVLTRLSNLSPHERAEKLDPAFHAFNSSRALNLKLFESVSDTLEQIRLQDISVVAHTESTAYGAIDRISRLGLEPYLKQIYCRQESANTHPTKPSLKWREEFPWDKVIRLPVSDVKPNARIIGDICKAENIRPSNTVYVGDSLARDMLMAKQAGTYSVWAKYGAKPATEDYDKLVKISHWTAEDVRREKEIQKEASGIVPDFVCQHSFAEVLAALELAAAGRNGSSLFRA